MVSRYTREDRLEAVMQSPRAVAIHDKQAWMAIFARYNIVEDPVGAPPHISGVFDAQSGVRGNGPLSRFYDCFIAPMQIVFHVDRDVVCGASVVRDMTIEIRMSPRVTLRVPMHAHYELVEEDGVLKVHHLAAHWELWPMLKQQMSFGLPSLSVGLALGQRMVSQLGIRGMLNFMSGVFNIGQAGKACVAAFVTAFNQRRFESVRDVLSRDFVGLAWPAAAALEGIEQLSARQGQLTLGKTLAAGNYITASFSLDDGMTPQCGVIFFEFNMHEKKIQRIRVYVDA
ncbi:MAG: hypothetical protein KBD60_09035 [Sterolibacterium sp.]|nr:hypothetical protein [Sterolibacterium sp.]